LALKYSFLAFHFSFSRDLYLTHLPSTPQLQFGIGSFHSAETEYQKINHTLIVYPNPPKSPCYARSVPKPISRINIGSLRPSPTASRCTHLAAAGPTSRAREERGEEGLGWCAYREGFVHVDAEEAGEHVGNGSAEGGGGLRAPIHAERSLLGSEEPAAAAQQEVLLLGVELRRLPPHRRFGERWGRENLPVASARPPCEAVSVLLVIGPLAFRVLLGCQSGLFIY